MSAKTSYRLSGLALLIGAALSIASLALQGMALGTPDLATILSPLDFFSTAVGIVGGILVLLGLPGMYARQAERAGIIGLLGFVGVWYVTLVQSVLLSFGNLTVMSGMAGGSIPRQPAILMTPPPAWGPFFLLSMVCEVLGILLLAIAILRAGVFPRWIGWTFVGTLVLGVVSLVPGTPDAVSTLVGIVATAAIGGVGFALLTGASGSAAAAAAATTPVSARTAAEA